MDIKKLFQSITGKLKRFWFSHYSEFFSISFLLPIVLIGSLWYYFFQYIDSNIIVNFYTSYSSTIFGASASVFGMSLAALSIFISVIYKPALPQMVQTGLLYIFLFPFFLTTLLWGLMLFTSFLTFFHSISPLIDSILIYKGIFFSYLLFNLFVAILYTIQLASHVIKTTVISFSKSDDTPEVK